MKILGISEGFHDAGATLIDGPEIISATHAERFSRKKNDRWLHPSQMLEASKVAFYEKPWLKQTRQWYAGQGTKKKRTDYDVSFYHHQSHMAAAYYTRPFEEEPVCVVIDAIGEWDTTSIWYKGKKKWSMKYPKSLGLFYSAITHYVGLKPMEDEYILMGMAGYGKPQVNMDYVLKQNLHKGLRDIALGSHQYHIAASAQHKLEQEIIKIMNKAKHYSDYLCYGGGVALNCVANSKIKLMFKEVWIMPNPGDCGSSLGAAALAYGKKLDWKDPYLGTEIKNEIQVSDVVQHLINNSYCGIANGRAEFGPRALGNRSLLADPRRDVKDTINQIKRRQKFRPFAPAILEEFASEYFEGPMNEYMQFVAKAKHDYKSVTHIDGTARVQVVKPNCKSIIRPILEEWYDKTGCPMLLNTSLNIKGQPMVDTWEHAIAFEKKYNVKVF